MYKKMMAALFITFALTNTVVAESYASITWSVSGIAAVKEVTMDVNLTTRYIAFNGLMVDTSNDATPISGTCFTTRNNTIYCTFQVFSGLMMTLDLQASSLNGSVRNFDDKNILLGSGIATLRNIY